MLRGDFKIEKVLYEIFYVLIFNLKGNFRIWKCMQINLFIVFDWLEEIV
jgi:hypothetical protein